MGEMSKRAIKSLSLVLVGLVIGFAITNVWFCFTLDPFTTVAQPGRAAPALPEGVDEATVDYVKDGDSFMLADGREVRLIGIDAPEIGLDQPYSRKAADYLKRLITGKSIALEFGRDRVDKHKRILVYAYIKVGDGRKMVNLEMVRRGMAYIYFYKGNIKYPEEFRKAQQDARAEKKGLWSLKVKPEKHYFVSSGLTHRPGCGKMIRSKKKKIRYSTRDEALDTGAPPCRKCEP